MDERFNRVHSCFKSSFPSWAAVFIGIGGALIVLPIPLVLVHTILHFRSDTPGSVYIWAATASIGTVMAVIGAAVGVSRWKLAQAQADADLDRYLTEDLAALGRAVLEEQGVGESELIAETVCVTGPRFWDIDDAKFRFRRGRDKRVRFSPLGIAMFHFTERYLLVLECVHDLATGKRCQRTAKHFYRDVTSVAIVRQSRTIQSKAFGTLECTVADVFSLTTADGAAYSVLLRDPALIKEMGGDIPSHHAESAVAAITIRLNSNKAD